jgi:predicted MFS family arabinose efflux permease
VITENPMTAQERRAVASLALLYSFRMIGLFMVLPLLALYAADMPGATPVLIGLALGGYGLTQALLQIPLGWLSDQVGRKQVIIGGLLMLVAGSVVAGTADTVYGIIIGRAMQGAGAIAGTVMALVADLTAEEQRTKAMALVGISIGLAFAVAIVLGPLVAAAGGLSAVFWFTALLAVIGIGVVLVLVPTPARVGIEHSDVGARRGLILRSLREPALARLNFGVFTLHFTLMACFLVLPGFLEELAGVDRDHHWQVYLPTLILSIVGMVPMLRMAERGGRPRETFLLGIGMTFVSVAIMGFTASAVALYLGLWLFFVGFNYLEATLPSLVSKSVFPGGKGTALGVYSTCQFFGIFCGGAIGGWVLQAAGKDALIMLCLGVVASWGVVSLLPARQPAMGGDSRITDA